MNSLCELEYEVDVFMGEHILEDRRTLWNALVEDSRKWNGACVDGTLVRIAERFVEERLNQLDEEQLAEMWRETEVGMESLEQGDEAEKWFMIHDIGLAVLEYILESVCEEAKKSSPRKPKRRT